jgi:putative ABC transport system permease protein
MEFKFALRSLRSNPGFSLLAIAILALGIGANTAIFSVVNTVLLRPLDYREPDRVVMIGNSNRERKTGMGQLSEPDFDDLHDQATAFDGLACFVGGGGNSVIVGKTAEFGSVMRVSPEFFHVMRTDARLGRLFSLEEEQPGGPPAAVISDAFWRRRFGGDPGAIGQTVRAYDKVFTVIGVLPPGPTFPAETDMYIARGTSAKNEHRSAHNFQAVGRLKEGVSLEQAQAQLDAIGARLEQAFPLSNKNQTFRAVPVRDQLVGPVKNTLYLLLGSVALVLLIACANVANLLLARATSRTREIALRAALGAGRWQIIRQLLIESAIIAVLAGGAGLALASWGIEGLITLSPANLPRLAEIRVDGFVMAFALGISLAASFLFGMAPAIQASRVDLNHVLKQGGGRAGVGATAGGLRGALVIAEIAISIVLLVGAGLLIRTFSALTSVPLGFNPERLLVVQANLASSTLEQSQRVLSVYDDVLRQVAGIPGVVAAAGNTGVPGGPPRSNGGYILEGGPGFDKLGMSVPQADFLVTTPGYFRALEIPLRSGRDFSARDNYDGEFVAVINESLARRSFPGQDPLGRRIGCGLDSPKLMTIVGVAADTRPADPAAAPRAAIYMPHWQHPRYGSSMSFVVRTQGEPMAIAEALRRKVREVNSEIPVKFTTMEARLAQTVASPRFRGILLGVFAGIAVLLAMAGVYGVMAYMVGQRTAEIGLRMALGAGRPTIVRMVLGSGARLAAWGLALGFAGAMATTRLVESMLFGVKATDLATFVMMAAAVGLIAMAACGIPAWRATRVDPLESLREE